MADDDNGWTIHALRVLMQERHEGYRQRFEAQEKALQKAESRTSDTKHNTLSIIAIVVALASLLVSLFLRR